MLKIRSYKGFDRKNVNIEDNSALFIGQTLQDKAICDHGKMLTILDFKEKILSIKKQYKKLYYSRHPYVKKGDEEVLNFLHTNNIQLINIPAYNLISSGKIKKVFSVSSSVVYEAKYMGCQYEFLYKPIIKIGVNYPDEYISIYQKFVSPVFWAEVLSPVIETSPCDDAYFLDTKDKLRDMLNFYWNYASIDKVEMLRKSWNHPLDGKRELSINDGKSSSRLTIKKCGYFKDFNKDKTIDKIIGSIKHSDIISFDIFETLIQRNLHSPTDLFYLIEKMCHIEGFAEHRKNIRKQFPLNKEEIILYDRYKELEKILNLDLTSCYHLEKYLEIDFCKKRELGYKLYKVAQKMHKKIIYTSDMYLDKEIILILLKKCGYDISNDLYLSSEYNATKLTGNLFKIIKKDFSGSILHIGDNTKSDFEVPLREGLKACVLQSSKENLIQQSKLPDAYKNMNIIAKSITLGIIQNKIYDSSLKKKTRSYFDGHPYNFGFSLIGIIMFSFAKFIIEDAINKKIDKLYFLSRDGDIIKQCYDILAQHYANAPQSYYLRASRRLYSVPSITTDQDIIERLSINFTPTSLYNLFKSRFGIDISSKNIDLCDFKTHNENVDFKKDKHKIIRFALANKNHILKNAKEEKEALLAYLKDKELYSNDNLGIVDIGHHGTLQKYLEELLNKKFHGYYFATFAEATKNIHQFTSFYVHKSEPYHICNIYQHFILMFESIFLNNEDSIIKFKFDNDILSPVFNHVKDINRKKFIYDVHRGCIDFCRTITATLRSKIADIRLTPDEACAPYIYFLQHPTYIDAIMFKNIEFENTYSARNIKYIIGRENSIWIEGKNVIDEADNSIGRDILSYIFSKILPEKKYNKFLSSPHRFFADSKHLIVRYLARFFH